MNSDETNRTSVDNCPMSIPSLMKFGLRTRENPSGESVPHPKNWKAKMY